MHRQYKVIQSRKKLPPIEMTYQGFDRDYNSLDLDYVAIVSVQGEIELYAIQDPKKVSDLLRYLVDREEGGKIIGCYKRI